MKHIFFILTLLFSAMNVFTQEIIINEKAVRESVERQMEVYPESTLKDLYKNFFQDRFGPGHLVNDTTPAKNYLLKELDSFSEANGEMFEPIGWQGNFYRVNLSVLKSNIIPMNIFFESFLQSANQIKDYPIEEWRKEWQVIEEVIKSMQLNLPDYETDSKEISERLNEGKYVGHHSKWFNDAYHPHYRIISKEIVEEKLFPFVERNQ